MMKKASDKPIEEMTEDELTAFLRDPVNRLNTLYKIIIKDDDGDGEDRIAQFKMNRAQQRFVSRLHHRNIILKARQMGFTTVIALIWLDYALFNPNVRCGIIAHNLESATSIFRDKVKFAYDNLPPVLKQAMPLKQDNASELLFGHNNSSIRVATSMRSGTFHRLHVSEFGKICAKFPDKAQEVITGSLPTVPLNGIVVIESTAEGREGEFYEMTKRALAKQYSGTKLTKKDYRLHFFPWFEAQEYRMPADSVRITDKDREYFEEVEAETGVKIDAEQRAWYVLQRDHDFSGHQERQWQEYPSTPQEAFRQSAQGTYYVKEFARARKEGRIGNVPWEQGIPVSTCWDVGLNDEMSIWFFQLIGQQIRMIRFYENSGEPFSHYVAYMQSLGYAWGSHYLPHDGDTQRLGTVKNWTPRQMLEDLGLRNIEIVPRIDQVIAGIQMTRDMFPKVWFDETNCADGLRHLENYRKEFNDRLGVWKETPRHDRASNGADAFRQLAQMKPWAIAETKVTRRKSESWRVI